MRVLGVESSCDETAVAIYAAGEGLLAHQLHSQVALHTDYGGVVPELASRDHLRKFIPLLRSALAEAALPLEALDAVAWTAGPGLAGALLVGAQAARSLAFAAGLPGLAVNHLEGHVLAPLLEDEPPRFPYLCLLVSGGHSELVRVDGLGRYRRLGGTVDDAAGEAFDKTAKLLGLGYPGGAALAALARGGDPRRFDFPRPMCDRPGLAMSFSGLKTAVATTCARLRAGGEAVPAADVAASFEQAVVDVLAIKLERAMRDTGLNTLVVAGGVGANRALRARLTALAATAGGRCHYPRPSFCTDNAAMIALVGALRLGDGESAAGLALEVRPRWPLEQLRPPRAGAN